MVEVDGLSILLIFLFISLPFMFPAWAKITFIEEAVKALYIFGYSSKEDILRFEETAVRRSAIFHLVIMMSVLTIFWEKITGDSIMTVLYVICLVVTPIMVQKAVRRMSSARRSNLVEE